MSYRCKQHSSSCGVFGLILFSHFSNFLIFRRMSKKWQKKLRKQNGINCPSLAKLIYICLRTSLIHSLMEWNTRGRNFRYACNTYILFDKILMNFEAVSGQLEIFSSFFCGRLPKSTWESIVYLSLTSFIAFKFQYSDLYIWI